MLIQGPVGLDLHIFQKSDQPRSFFLITNVDGDMHRQNSPDFHTFSKIVPLGVPRKTEVAGRTKLETERQLGGPLRQLGGHHSLGSWESYNGSKIVPWSAVS